MTTSQPAESGVTSKVSSVPDNHVDGAVIG